MVLAYSSCSFLWILSLVLIVSMSDLAMPRSLTGSSRLNPWMTLAAVSGDMGLVWGTGMAVVTLDGQKGRGSRDAE